MSSSLLSCDDKSEFDDTVLTVEVVRQYRDANPDENFPLTPNYPDIIRVDVAVAMENHGLPHKTIVDPYSRLPRVEYRASPEEVAWYYLRERQLKAEGVSSEPRIKIMRKEAKHKLWVTRPWEKVAQEDKYER